MQGQQIKCSYQKDSAQIHIYFNIYFFVYQRCDHSELFFDLLYKFCNLGILLYMCEVSVRIICKIFQKFSIQRRLNHSTIHVFSYDLVVASNSQREYRHTQLLNKWRKSVWIKPPAAVSVSYKYNCSRTFLLC